MGHFRASNMPLILTTESIRRAKTIVDSQWYLDVKGSDSGINFVACNNEYREWLWTVSDHPFFIIFGSFQTRLERAKKKYQKWIDRKNSKYIFYNEISNIV